MVDNDVVKKLVDGIQAGVEKLGIEAVRLWPQIVEIHRIKCIAGCVLVLVALALGPTLLYRYLPRFLGAPPGRDPEAQYVPPVAIGVVLCVIGILTFAINGFDLVAGMFYPEASLVLSWMASGK